MPIGKGIVKFDDYNKFGHLLDCASERGAVNFSYSPRKNVLVIMCRARDVDDIRDNCIKDYSIVDVKVWHNMAWIKVKVG